MKLSDTMKNFTEYIENNLLMHEIYKNALDRIDKGEKLTPVQRVVMLEWTTAATARLHQLELESQHAMLSDEKYAELASLTEQIAKVRNFT